MYEYRLRVKLKNPNFQRQDEVSKESDADTEELPPLDEHWYVFPQKVVGPAGRVPLRDRVHQAGAEDGIRAARSRRGTEGQAVVQFQRWTNTWTSTRSSRSRSATGCCRS